jgi:hypothetical protein
VEESERETVGEEEKEKKEGSTRVTVKSERERQNGGGGGRKEGIPRMAHLRWSDPAYARAARRRGLG